MRDRACKRLGPPAYGPGRPGGGAMRRAAFDRFGPYSTRFLESIIIGASVLGEIGSKALSLRET